MIVSKLELVSTKILSILLPVLFLSAYVIVFLFYMLDYVTFQNFLFFLAVGFVIKSLVFFIYKTKKEAPVAKYILISFAYIAATLITFIIP